MKRIGLLGGTFDPPHLGHLLIAEEVRLALGLEEIWFIPSNVPPHKQTLTRTNDRVQMVERAIEDHPNFKMHTIELTRTGKSYTVDTMKSLQEMYPETRFSFIIGADMVEYLPKWHDIKTLIETVQFVGVQRTGYSVETDLPVEIIDIPLFDVSSTMIRQRIASGVKVRYYLPDAVNSYIEEHELYGRRNTLTKT